jgi:phosphocarrier protein FPr
MTRLELHGRVGSPGIGMGNAIVIRPEVPGPPADASGSGTPGGTPAGERERLTTALATAATELEALAAGLADRAGDEISAIFEAQALLARDPAIVEPALRAIDAGVGAEEAILASIDEQAGILAAVDDEYFRARAADVRDVGRRVAAILRGEARADLWHPDGRPAVVVADDLDPSVVAILRPELTAAIALAGGAPTGHASIVARGLGIPLVLGLGPEALAVADDVELLVDAPGGGTGRLVVEPTPAELAEAVALQQARAEPTPAGPTGAIADGAGGAGVAVLANVGSLLEAQKAARLGAAGIGLVRTELLFPGHRSPPSVAEQRNLYARISDAMAPHPVVFRTLDVGGDKPTAWQAGQGEANPALGVRGVRLGLARPALLDDQLRALVDAAAGGEVRVMLPMVATVEEVSAVRARLERIVGDAAPAPSSVELGVMIEVPAAALVADGLAGVADFFSIGTNDLVQYTLAADRINAALADLATPLQPAVLRLIDGVCRAARARDRHVAVCGEAAADPEVVPILVGLGVTELSVAPDAIGAVTARVAALDPAACRTLATAVVAAGSLAEVRAVLASAAG